MTTQRSFLKLIDIGANLTDKVFRGVYRGRQRHESDFASVLNRASDAGVLNTIVTSGSLSDCEEAINLCQHDKRLFCTAGCHPTRAQEYATDSAGYTEKLENFILLHRDKVVAVGECGLDYDREEFCSRVTQVPCFEAQLKLAAKLDLPLFLHCRAAHEDFIHMVENVSARLKVSFRGVVHSFDGILAHAMRLIDMGFFIGINGCSLKTEENLKVVKALPTDSILLETDAPWCEIRPTHAGFQFVQTHRKYVKTERWQPGSLVKGRNEPCNLVQVLEVVAGVKEMPADQLAQVLYSNTLRLFPTLS